MFLCSMRVVLTFGNIEALTGVLEADTAMLASMLRTFSRLWLSMPPNRDRNIVFLVVSLAHAEMYSQITSISCNSCRGLMPTLRRPPRRSVSQNTNSAIISIAMSICFVEGAARPTSSCSENYKNNKSFRVNYDKKWTENVLGLFTYQSV